MVYGMDLICGQRWRSQACFLRLRLKFWMQNTFVPQRFWECLGYFFTPVSLPVPLWESWSPLLCVCTRPEPTPSTAALLLCDGNALFRHLSHTNLFISTSLFCTSYSSFNFKIFRYISCLLWHHLSKNNSNFKEFISAQCLEKKWNRFRRNF